tara:strand:- start:162 stop:434 length:273 start_codon:yes stop_codon:yes gene_type:complete
MVLEPLKPNTRVSPQTLSPWTSGLYRNKSRSRGGEALGDFSLDRRSIARLCRRREDVNLVGDVDIGEDNVGAENVGEENVLCDDFEGDLR